MTNSIQIIVNLAITLTDPVDKESDSDMERLLSSLIKSQATSSRENILNSINEENNITLGENINIELAKTIQLK